MTPNELLQKFMQEKDAIIFKAAGLHLYDPEDYEDAKNFTTEQVVKFFENIHKDDLTCIWCTVFLSKDCVGCGYGERHRRCWKNGSHYDNLCRGVHGRVIHFHRLTGMKHLVAKAEEAFKEITNGTQTDSGAR